MTNRVKMWHSGDMVLTFDTQQIYRSFANEGNFTDAQAQTLTDALRDVASLNIEHLASKDDLEAMENAVKTNLNAVDNSVRSEIELLRKDMIALEQRLTIKLGGMMVVGLGVIVAMQQLLGS